MGPKSNDSNITHCKHYMCCQ